MYKFIYKNFPVKTFIKDIEDKNRKGDAEIVSIVGGDNIGIREVDDYNVFDEQNNSIGKIKIHKIGADQTKCKVKSGGDIISSKMAAGAKLKVVAITE